MMTPLNLKPFAKTGVVKKLTYLLVMFLFLGCFKEETNMEGYWLVEWQNNLHSGYEYNEHPDSNFLYAGKLGQSPYLFTDDTIELAKCMRHIFSCLGHSLLYRTQDDVFEVYSSNDSSWKELTIEKVDSQIILKRPSGFSYILTKIEKPKIYNYPNIKRIDLSLDKSNLHLAEDYRDINYLIDFDSNFINICFTNLGMYPKNNGCIKANLTKIEKDLLQLQMSKIDSTIAEIYEPIEPYFPDIVLKISFEDNTSLRFEIKNLKTLPMFLRFLTNHIISYRYSEELDFVK